MILPTDALTNEATESDKDFLNDTDEEGSGDNDDETDPDETSSGTDGSGDEQEQDDEIPKTVKPSTSKKKTSYSKMTHKALEGDDEDDDEEEKMDYDSARSLLGKYEPHIGMGGKIFLFSKIDPLYKK